MNDDMKKTIGSKLPTNAYNEISLDSISGSDNLTRTEKIRRQKLKEEERSKAEIVKVARQVEDMEAVLRAAANRVKANEIQQGREIDSEERDVAIMSEALQFLTEASTNRKEQNRISMGREELDFHIKGSRM